MAIDLDVHGNTQPLEAAVQAAVNRIRRTPIKITVDDRGATQPLGNMKRGADEFTKSMEAANARILAFGASMAIINGVADSFKAMVRNMVEVEKAMADINVVMGLSSQSLEKFGDGLFKVAKETGAAFNIAAQAATEYARQGLAVEESLKRTRDALILTRLTGMDSAEAVKSLTAAMNTYGNQIKDTTQLVSKFAAVDVQFAVSAEDFAQAISRTGAAAKGAGVDIDELIGIVTAAQQQTARGGAVIGNSLKTIFTRIGRADTLNQLESLGIAVRDVEGNTIGAKRILTDLANTFDKLGEAQKSQIAQTVGGVFQINILKAILGDAAKQNGILARATQISSSATDEAIDKNEQLRNTMAAMATETGLSLKQLSAEIGELMLAPGVEKILNTVKSLSEGISGALGDGESIGGKFGKGFLTGIGNIITGPGLVVVFAVLGKLAAQAFKFTKESLTSLVGVTSESQKQKAIQTSLVTLFGQNAALNKEILRTDISRTEKEKIILGLLQAQTVEANKLNAISKQLASTLYSRGYGPNLTKGKSRAYGHIPNFAHPEREQAAKGGYAAGTIRSINMPGEGSVIYNSAEKVKNFKGMSQPAIMPPQSSKAGKNYQQAFGNIHGFDPYAAGGFIPNYAKTTVSKTSDIPKNLNSKKLGDLNKDSSLILLTADSSTADSKSKFFIGKDPRGDTKILNTSDLASKRTTGYYGVNVPYYSIDRKDKTKAGKEDLPAIQKAIRGAAINKALDIATAIVGGEKNLRPYNKEQIEKTFNDGAFKAASGSTFESAIAAALKSHLFQDYQARTDTSAIDLPYDPRLFAYFGAPAGAGKMGAEVKADLANKLQQGAAKKFYEVLAGGRAAWEYKDKDYKDKTGGRAAYAGLERRGSGYFKKRKAYGHIPNFADPLSDAIGREKAAGVPVSQIRIGSHGALMGKGNPLGLGVTNTHDEPNGLRDVFGANGFVPNYAPPQISASDITGYRGRGAQAQMDENAKKYNEVLKRSIKAFKDGYISKKTLNQRTKDLGQRYHVSSQTQQGVEVEIKKSTATIKNLNAARNRASNILSASYSSVAGGASRLNTKFSNTLLGRGLGSTGGQMGLMMGAPMLAGMLQGEGPGKVNDAQYQAGGALMGVGTGAAIGMMFGPLGAAIGGVVGGFSGLLSASEDLKKAQEEAAKAERESSIQTGAALAQSLAPSLAKTDFGKSGVVEFSFGGKQRKIDVDNFNKLSAIDPSKSGGFGMRMGDFRSKMLEQSGVNIGDLLKFGFPGAKKAAGKNKKYQASGAASAMKEILESEGLTGTVTSEDFLKKALTTTAYTPRGERAGVKMEDLGKATKKIEDQILAQMGSAARPEAIKAALDQLPKDMKIQTAALKKDSTAGGRAFKKGDLEYFTPEELKRQIDEGNPAEIAKAYEDILKQIDVQKTLNEENNQAIILQLNAQRAILAAQQKSKEIQFDIKSSYAQIDSSLSLQAKLMGSFATEQQKAQMNYTKAVNKAAEKYATGSQSEEGRYRASMLAFSKDKVIAGALKTSLAKKQILSSQGPAGLMGDNLANTVEKMDLTEKLVSLSNEELYAELKKLELTDAQRQTLEDFKNSKEESVELLLKELQISGKIAENEFKINDAIAKRKDLLANMSGAIGMSDKQLAHDQKMRGFTSQLAAAQRLTDVGPGYQTRAEQEDFQMREKQISLENTATTLRGNATSAVNKKIKERTDLELQQQLTKEQIDASVNPFDKNELKQTLVKQQQALAFINHEIKNINESTEEEISNAQKLLNLEKQRLADKRKHETGPGAFGRGMQDSFKSMREQAQYMDHQLGEKIPFAFADGMANAMTEAINGTKDLKDALSDAAMGFLGMIQQAMMQSLAYRLVGGMGFAMPGMMSRGGNVRNYSRGGGVPARVSDGEYVMGRDAVNKYGGSFMHGLNAGGRIPGFSDGGSVERDLIDQGVIKRESDYSGTGAKGSALAANFGGGRGFKSGRQYQRRAMSSFFYKQSGNVGLEEDVGAMGSILQEEERRRQEAERKRQEKKAKRRQLIGMLISTAVMAGISHVASNGPLTGTAKAAGYGANTPGGVNMAIDSSGMAVSTLPGADLAGSGFTNATPTRSWNPMSWNSPSTVNPELGPFFYNQRYLGGPIRKYASGGYISGKSGIDQIPAMLSEGEYVIRASSARQIGKPMLDRINAGKFNEGGPVTEMKGSQESSSTGSGNTNNINISINLEKGSSKEDASKNQNQEGDRSNEQMKEFSDKIKKQVLSVIVEEQRPGGLLQDTK